ncbi:MAG: hypothetical protein ACRDM8_01655 [Gaiellaceae bacterium]
MRDRLPVALSAAALAVALVGATPLGHAALTVVDLARNADKVDGKHAVAFGTAVGKRKGKLVATSPQTGLLPSNIISRVPRSDRADRADDADRLDGLDSSAFAQGLWAVVNSNGSLARGRGAVSAASLGVDGQCQVVFDRNVAACAYVATLGDAGPSTGAVGVVTVAPRDGNANAVFVQTYNSETGVEVNLPFHLVAVC